MSAAAPGPQWDEKAYATFRPTYPSSLYAAILEFGGPGMGRELGVDVGCGSGQVTTHLAQLFTHVVGLDLSPAQLSTAAPAPNVEYRVGSAEATGVPAATVDLVNAAAALHWFDRPAFYREVRRILKPGSGVLAAWSYSAGPRFPPHQAAAQDVYQRLADAYFPYFDPRLQAVIKARSYAGMEPSLQEFAVVQRRTVEMEWAVTVEALCGWARSWSGYVKLAQEQGTAAAAAPIEAFRREISAVLGLEGEEVLQLALPLDLVLARDAVAVA